MNVILRKTGNSNVITIPNKIKEMLGVEIGEEVEFVTSGNTVIIRKAEPRFDFDKELEKAMIQYQFKIRAIQGEKNKGTIYQFTPTTIYSIYDNLKKGDFQTEIVFYY